MKKYEKSKYLGFDIGGTWIKGVVVDEDFFQIDRNSKSKFFQIKKIRSPLHVKTTIEEFIEALKKLIASFKIDSKEVKGIGISTAGIVNYHGTRVLKAAAHLSILKNNSWQSILEKELQCCVTIINDADAASIGLAEIGYLAGNKTIGIMPIGTGLGFTVWRNGRRWRPGKSLSLLGSIRTPAGSYDSIASVSKLAGLDENTNLINVLTNSSFQIEREKYMQNMVNIINSAAILYNLDEVIICGGLADASITCNYPLEKILNKNLEETPVELEKSVRVIVATEGNKLQLVGALTLARGEFIATNSKVVHSYNSLATEIPYKKELQLQNMSTLDIIETMWQAEQEAGSLLKNSLSIIGDIADKSITRIETGGRIIYVGAGTSGRIAAMDAVEIPCTYGLPEEQILALIAGGISDAAIEIESDFEEDASAVPEMLLLNIQPEDIVIGISASGAAYYIQSALAFAKERKALSVLIQAEFPEIKLPFCDYVIPLNSGNEVVAGSTRMKAGTAIKKVLNFLSSTIMIKMGKVSGPYMIDVACINNKLIERAKKILYELYGFNEQDAHKILQMNNFNLRDSISEIDNSR
ncbi:MAG: N-acetylmuramic acid 6-phosphate etherase [Lutibacter sp.]|nr:N-acetylmuramic acid 6-phosphate etherase [Lutibacter sp.]